LDVVVMQHGPSAEPASRAHLCDWSKRFADLARSRGARRARRVLIDVQ
jgi:hypothetical protein